MNKEAICKTCGDTGTKVVHNEFGAVIHQASGACPDCQQPPSREFTEKIRKFIKMYENEVPRRAEITFLEEAIESLDRAEASKNDLLTVLENALVSLAVIAIPREDNNVATDAEILKIMGDSFEVAIAQSSTSVEPSKNEESMHK